MNWKLSLLTASICGLSSAFSGGFGLYEASTKTYAMGGAAIAQAFDASANFFNPATLSDLSAITVTTGFMTEHPRGRIKTDGKNNYATMDPGVFILPYFHAAIPLPADLTFGLGIMPEYGLGSEYDDNWPLAGNSVDTTVTSFTINPNLAYSITDTWSIGAGFRFLYFDFEQHAIPIPGNTSRLKGDNDLKDWGWQIGSRYRLTDSLSIGVVYKSRTLVHVFGKSQHQPLAIANGSADTELLLPQSITAGFNWDINDSKTWHLGGAVAWTEWSTVDTLDFHLGNINKPIKLNWHDTYRIAIAPCWDFTDNWTLLSSYVFETDCSGRQDSTMLPPSERHMISFGLNWEFLDNLEFTLSYGIILMSGRTSDCTTLDNVKHTYRAHRAMSHATGVGITYRF